jgi:Family of unknown function (DUF6064)
MGEWLTYSLADFLLFSPRTYYRLFELYNRAVWPAQVAALAVGAAILVLLRRAEAATRIVVATLAAGWLWVAWAYHLQRYDSINWAASYYAVAFGAEALLLAWAALRLTLRTNPTGLALFLFALVLQPLIGPLLGRPWAQVELFGLAPDPTAVGTLGLVLLADGRVRWELLAIPLLWSIVTGLTLWAMGSPEALVAPLAAVVAVLAALRPTSRPAAGAAA